MDFIKAQSLGNDFVIIETDKPNDLDICWIADRKYGIGCDQVIAISNGNVRFWNQDGSEADFCGNGIRCAVLYLHECARLIPLNTKSGIVKGEVIGDSVKIKYPNPGSFVEKDGYYDVDVGNKHIVIIGEYRVTDWTPLIARFGPTNIMHLSKSGLSWFMDIYERGVGPTKACGSGAMAAAVVLGQPVTIHMAGGSLRMEEDCQTGPATLVFRGRTIRPLTRRHVLI